MRYLVVASPAAGNTDDSNLDAALAVLREHGEVEVAESGSPEDLKAVLDRVDERLLVIAGGDGSLHAVIQGLHDRDELGGTTLGLIPLGTGNDFARSLGLPLEPAAAARAVAAGTPRPLDLLVDDEGGVIVNSVHVGAGATAAKVGARWKERIGKAGYVVGALLTAIRPPTVRVRVEVDGEVLHEGSVLQVAVGNGVFVGGGTPLVPDADPADGEIDVLVARPTTGWARLVYAARLVVGRHHRHREVHTYRGSTVTTRGEAFWCSADGELTGPHHARSWHIEPSAYRLVRP